MTFSIVSIAEQLQLELVRRTGEEYIFICPFCSGQKKYPKLYINEPKGCLSVITATWKAQ
jgi:hypothetical protein